MHRGFRNNGCVKMMSHRPLIVQSELEKRYDFIFSNVDAIRIKSPLPYFKKDLYPISKGDDNPENDGKDIDIWAQIDPNPKLNMTTDDLCPGFMVYRSSPNTIALVRKRGNLTTDVGELRRNQGAFNELISLKMHYNLTEITTKSLPNQRFVSGLLYF